jgi:hypothetical protein
MTCDAATRLLTSLQTMGDLRTNAVLMALNGAQTITPYERYPNESIYFGAGAWRVFYHCHDEQNVDPREHGHFHFFCRTTDTQAWSHVVAMGVSATGLPIHLFTTNLWVNDGVWFHAQELGQQMDLLRDSQDDALLASWFKYMLLVFQEEIQALLWQRDAQLMGICPDDLQHCFSDRNIYLLSQCDIDLQTQLSRYSSLSSTRATSNLMLQRMWRTR